MESCGVDETGPAWPPPGVIPRVSKLTSSDADSLWDNAVEREQVDVVAPPIDRLALGADPEVGQFVDRTRGAVVAGDPLGIEQLQRPRLDRQLETGVEEPAGSCAGIDGELDRSGLIDAGPGFGRHHPADQGAEKNEPERSLGHDGLEDPFRVGSCRDGSEFTMGRALEGDPLTGSGRAVGLVDGRASVWIQDSERQIPTNVSDGHHRAVSDAPDCSGGSGRTPDPNVNPRHALGAF